MTRTLSSQMDPARSAQVRALLIDTVAGAPSVAAHSRRPRASRYIAMAAVGLGTLGLGTGAAVSVTQFLQPDGLQFSCVLGAEDDSPVADKRAAVADPLAVCRGEWPAGSDVPELAVFMDDIGTVYVAPATWDAEPRGLTRVSQDVAFDPRPARLQAALDDRIDGLQSDCFSNSEAIERVGADFQRLGLVGWSTHYEDDGGREEPADGVQTCATAGVASDGSAREVVVRGVIKGDPTVRFDLLDEAELRAHFTQEYRSGVKAGQDYVDSETVYVEDSVATQLSYRTQLQELRAAFSEQKCLTTEQARQTATQVLDPTWNPVVEVYVDETLPCSVVEAGLGGTWLVSIVGPTTTP